jgi:hypothetical protein
VRKLTRLQSFVTRYRPHAQEAGLLRHIDGASVDGSLILALSGADGGGGPTDIAFEGGGVTVWEGGDGAAGTTRGCAALRRPVRCVSRRLSPLSLAPLPLSLSLSLSLSSLPLSLCHSCASVPAVPCVP